MSARVPLLFGPTASGKTTFALAWAQRTGGNLLSADARQVYQDMNVVVGKDVPEGATWEQSPESTLPPAWKLAGGNWLFGLDIVPPTEVFTISHWYQWVQPILAWHKQQNLPLLIVGGTWPWLQVLFDPPASLLVPPDPVWREQAQRLSLPQLQQRAESTAPERWAALSQADQRNRRRLIRIIEVAQSPDIPVPAPLLAPDEYEIWLRDASMDDLTAAIQERVLHRWSHDALEETEHLLETYPDWSSPSFSASGYPVLRAHLEGKLTVEETLRRWTWAERQYAKRQRTWLKKIEDQFPTTKV